MRSITKGRIYEGETTMTTTDKQGPASREDILKELRNLLMWHEKNIKGGIRIILDRETPQLLELLEHRTHFLEKRLLAIAALERRVGELEAEVLPIKVTCLICGASERHTSPSGPRVQCGCAQPQEYTIHQPDCPCPDPLLAAKEKVCMVADTWSQTPGANDPDRYLSDPGTNYCPPRDAINNLLSAIRDLRALQE